MLLQGRFQRQSLAARLLLGDGGSLLGRSQVAFARFDQGFQLQRSGMHLLRLPRDVLAEIQVLRLQRLLLRHRGVKLTLDVPKPFLAACLILQRLAQLVNLLRERLFLLASPALQLVHLLALFLILLRQRGPDLLRLDIPFAQPLAHMLELALGLMKTALRRLKLLVLLFEALLIGGSAGLGCFQLPLRVFALAGKHGGHLSVLLGVLLIFSAERAALLLESAHLRRKLLKSMLKIPDISVRSG
mmetsp:Transcript_1247/g.5322  ORF Transcript_1247/g.5322 Transcript_1247/m.5322 type:complete len:244 (+) Transcript_1247:993-1724(+)